MPDDFDDLREYANQGIFIFCFMKIESSNNYLSIYYYN